MEHCATSEWKENGSVTFQIVTEVDLKTKRKKGCVVSDLENDLKTFILDIFSAFQYGGIFNRTFSTMKISSTPEAKYWNR